MNMVYETLRQEYLKIPVVTRFYTTACLLTTLAVQLDLVTTLQLYFNPNQVMKYEVWRLATTFLFLGPVGFGFVYKIAFSYSFCRALEEGAFRGRTSDFVSMLLFCAVCMLAVEPYANFLFLGPPLGMALVYVWSRKPPIARVGIFGVLGVDAPYLPWHLLVMRALTGRPVSVEVLGMAVGHCYYFLEDVFPNLNGGFRVIKTPRFLKTLLDAPTTASSGEYAPFPEDLAGGAGAEPPPQH